MTREEYLIERGWRRSGGFPGDGKDQWYDMKGAKLEPGNHAYKDAVIVEVAHAIQLDRDATLRDYVNAHRPVMT